MVLTTTEFDTIAAISTPPGEGGISIVRISGEEALNVAKSFIAVKTLIGLPAIPLIMVILSTRKPTKKSTK